MTHLRSEQTNKQMKRNKSTVNYTRVGSEKEHCGICVHFQKPSACRIVGGEIVAGGWCKLWKGKNMARGYDNDEWDRETAKAQSKALNTMPARLRKTSIISSRRATGAISERAAAKLRGRRGKYRLGLFGAKERNNPDQGRGAKHRGAIDQDQRPQFPEESEVRNRGGYATSNRPSNVASPTPPGMANYYGGPASRPGGGSSGTYYGDKDRSSR
jgi:hypothetical protein